ncbi:GNAT family N-acetyltransferase [Candidatus Pacearchaeota archaeon]|nr:GNAT family N-acetyltransferase [Candidatus Pacearchaeota archaeon]
MNDEVVQKKLHFEELFIPDSQYVGILYYNGKLVGSATLNKQRITPRIIVELGNDECFFFNRLKVQPGNRGRGFGKILIDKVVNFFQEHRLSIWNELNPYGHLDKDELRDFYLRYGFKRFDDNIVYFVPEEDSK